MFVVVMLCGTENGVCGCYAAWNWKSDVCGCYAAWNWKVMFVVVMLCGTGK